MSGTQTETYQSLAAQYAEQYGLPVQAFLDRVTQESSWNPDAINSSTGAIGLGQILPSTAADPGYGIAPVTDLADLADPSTNLSFSAQLLAAYIKATGSVSAGLAKYTGQPQSNFTQYDGSDTGVTTTLPSTPIGGLASTSPTLSTSGTQSNVNAQTSWSGLIGRWLIMATIVVLGMIFVAVGLKMMANPGTNAIQAAGKLAKGAGRVAAIPAAVA